MHKILHFPRMTLYPVTSDDKFHEITCEWEVDREDEGYVTSCGHWHPNEEGVPEQEIQFCPYCNAKIYLEGKDDDESDMESR